MRNKIDQRYSDRKKRIVNPLPMALLKNNPRVLCLAALLVISATFLSCDASYGVRGIFLSLYSYLFILALYNGLEHFLDDQTNACDCVMSLSIYIYTYNFGHGLNIYMLGCADGEGFNKFCVGWDQGCKDPVNGIPSQCQIYCRDNGFVLEKGKCAPDNGKPNRMCCCYK